MADTKITGLDALATAVSGDLLAIVNDPAGIPVTKKITIDNALKKLFGNLDVNGNMLVDANGNELLDFSATASAVNYLKLVNSATGNGVELQALGDDTNIDLLLTPKGTGEISAGGIISFPNQSGCSVYLGSSQSITADTNTKIEFDTENYDTQNEFDSTTNYRFTATKAGVYIVKVSVYFGVAGDQDGLRLNLRVNDVSTKTCYKRSSGAFVHTVEMSTDIKLDANDYVEIYASNDDDNDTLTGVENVTWLTISKIQ